MATRARRLRAGRVEAAAGLSAAAFAPRAWSSTGAARGPPLGFPPQTSWWTRFPACPTRASAWSPSRARVILWLLACRRQRGGPAHVAGRSAPDTRDAARGQPQALRATPTGAWRTSPSCGGLRLQVLRPWRSSSDGSGQHRLTARSLARATSWEGVPRDHRRGQGARPPGNDLVALVSETVELRQRGQEFWGCAAPSTARRTLPRQPQHGRGTALLRRGRRRL